VSVSIPRRHRSRAISVAHGDSGVLFGQNAGVLESRTKPGPIAPSPSAEEAAAIVAALERFMRATAPPPASTTEGPDPWRHAAILEGVERGQPGDVPDPWINT
jgi:hypothetical protein